MQQTRKSISGFCSRLLTGSLILGFTFGTIPAYALRDQQKVEGSKSGLEEIVNTFLSGDPNEIRQAGTQLASAVGLTPATLSSTIQPPTFSIAAGMEKDGSIGFYDVEGAHPVDRPMFLGAKKWAIEGGAESPLSAGLEEGKLQEALLAYLDAWRGHNAAFFEMRVLDEHGQTSGYDGIKAAEGEQRTREALNKAEEVLWAEIRKQFKVKEAALSWTKQVDIDVGPINISNPSPNEFKARLREIIEAAFAQPTAAGMEEVGGLRDRINLLPAVQMKQNSVGVIAGPEDERGWAYGVALLKRSRTATREIVPVVFLVENEAEVKILQSLGVSPEVMYRIGSAEYPTREVALQEATNYLRGGLDVAQIIWLGVSEKISPIVEQVLLNLFGIRLDANAAVQWKEVIDAVVYTFQQA